MRFWAWLFPGFFFVLGAFFAALAVRSDTSEERLTFWIMAASFVGSSLLIAAVALMIQRTVMRATRLIRTGSQKTATGATVFGGDPAALEAAVRQALGAKGVTGALQDEAVRKTLAAAASGQSLVDLREYTHEGADADQPQPAPDPVEQIERLAKLRDSGAITEGEFIAAKTRLLSDL